MDASANMTPDPAASTHMPRHGIRSLDELQQLRPELSQDRVAQIDLDRCNDAIPRDLKRDLRGAASFVAHSAAVVISMPTR